MRCTGTLICVDDIERSKRFYSDLFSLNVEVIYPSKPVTAWGEVKTKV
jgi:predicted enzyme related to lactoylglutathione lyase